VWCLPLVAATAQPAARQPRAAGELAPRHFAVSLAVLSALWGYPVWGSQGALSLFLLIPVALVSCSDCLRYGCWQLGKLEVLRSSRRSDRSWALAYVGVVAVVGLSLIWAGSAAKAYYGLQPAGLRGSRLLRMPPKQVDFYRRLIEAARAHGRSVFTMPGMNSLYFWTDTDPPTSINSTTWMTLLTPDQQTKVVEDLRKAPDLCVIRCNPLVKFWVRGLDISGNKVVRYIEDNFVTAESFGGTDILVRRAAAPSTRPSPPPGGSPNR